MSNPSKSPAKQGNGDIPRADEATRWKPGQSGNPHGRPPKTGCVTSLLRELLEGEPKEVMLKWKLNPTGAMTVAMGIYHKLAQADMTAVKDALDRVEGKPPQAVNLGGGEGRPIRVQTVGYERVQRTD